MDKNLEIILKLLVSFVLGAAVGFEREKKAKPAGLKTISLISVGSCLMTIISIEFYKTFFTGDPGRIAAQIITGIGFLGAGSIIRSGATVKGLTTAATIWAIAGIGMAIALGLYIPAVAAVLLILFILRIMSKLEQE